MNKENIVNLDLIKDDYIKAYRDDAYINQSNIEKTINETNNLINRIYDINLVIRNANDNIMILSDKISLARHTLIMETDFKKLGLSNKEMRESYINNHETVAPLEEEMMVFKAEIAYNNNIKEYYEYKLKLYREVLKYRMILKCNEVVE